MVAQGIAVASVTPEMLDAAVRLFEVMESEADRNVPAAQTVREILYRALVGDQGHLLPAAGHSDGRFAQISRALTLIHREYGRALDVSELAREAGMSASSFFEAFKAVTSWSPVQYVTEIRLNRARQMMIWEGISAQRAARRAGYASPSQFGREFKRRFGWPPARERAWALESGELRGARPYSTARE